MKKHFVVALVAALLSITPAITADPRYDWEGNGVHITGVEATNVPDHVSFQLDYTEGNCSAGSWLIWPGQGPDVQSQHDNVKAVYAMLLAANLTGYPIDLFGRNPGSPVGRAFSDTCVGVFIHLIANPKKL